MTDPMELVGRATEASDLRDRIMNPNVAKSEAEWWASREIERLEACIREMVERGERSVDYEIWQDGVLVAGSDNEADARHYAAVYEQDGPVDAFKVVSFRSPLPPAPGAEA